MAIEDFWWCCTDAEKKLITDNQRSADWQLPADLTDWHIRMFVKRMNRAALII